MPVTPTYPGVYIEELSSGVRTITGVATSITAFVGYTARGPINMAIRIFNYGDYERNFGGLHPDSDLSYAVQQFFLNGGSDAYVVRAARGAAAAQVGLRDAANAATVLNVRAASEGAWGNSVRIEIDYATSNPYSTFNMTVTRYERRNNRDEPAETERFQNLSMNSRAAAYAVDVVKSSKIVQLERLAGLAFGANGFSSGSVDIVPFAQPLAADQNTLSGVLDGDTPFTLVLNAPLPNAIDGLRNALNDRITNLGLNLRMEARRADVSGTDDAAGQYIKLLSLTAGETSSVEILSIGSRDLAQALGLGRLSRGREVDGAAALRPAVTGTQSGDLTNRLTSVPPGVVNANINNVLITDRATGQILFDGPPPGRLLNGSFGEDVRGKLETIIRGIDHPAARTATVRLVGSNLVVRASPAAPTATIELTGPAATTALLNPPNATTNVREYVLGTSVAYGAQVVVGSGQDGNPPTGVEIIGNRDAKTGMYALRNVDLFNMMVIPATTRLPAGEASAVIAAAVAFCEEERAFLILDADPRQAQTAVPDWASRASKSRNAAVFYPQIRSPDPLQQFRLRDMPAGGAVAGVFARTDVTRGIWKAPAGIEAILNGVQGLSVPLTDQENGPLNENGVNALRYFRNAGFVVWGTRTRRGADSDADDYKYIPVRRLALYLEESLFRGTQWVVFEPNDEPLWAQIRLNLGTFMQSLFRQGAFAGKSPRDAYFVKCDRETTTPDDVNRGIVNIVVGFAPLKPAEFVIIKIQQISNLAAV